MPLWPAWSALPAAASVAATPPEMITAGKVLSCFATLCKLGRAVDHGEGFSGPTNHNPEGWR